MLSTSTDGFPTLRSYGVSLGGCSVFSGIHVRALLGQMRGTVLLVRDGTNRLRAPGSFLLSGRKAFLLDKVYVRLVFVKRDVGAVSGGASRTCLAGCPGVY